MKPVCAHNKRKRASGSLREGAASREGTRMLLQSAASRLTAPSRRGPMGTGKRYFPMNRSEAKGEEQKMEHFRALGRARWAL